MKASVLAAFAVFAHAAYAADVAEITTEGVAIDMVKRFAPCQSAYEAAREKAIITFLEWRAPHRRALVHVGPTFFQTSREERQELLDTINCYLVRTSHVCVNFNFYDDEGGGRVVGRARDCQYIDGPGR